ncbi:MAG TPA: metallophosphoesterase family protein [Symbiobacteriaceae bacterium]|nr:metallophosphoesterase family protein [Symbiobacteriaceae bacterium]
MGTRLAVISDIHGNAPALRAILAEIDATPGVEHIYCLGDSVSIGPDANEVLDMLFARPDLSMVKGNHERYILAVLAGGLLPPEVEAEELEHQRWISSRLNPDHADHLSALPDRLEVEHGGRRFWFLHYHADAGRPGRFAPWMNDVAQLEEHYATAPADVVCFGHDHTTRLLRGAQRLYLNPGSAGCFSRPVARYALVTVEAGDVSVEMREADYDNRDFLASYDRLGVPARDFILRIFHGNQGR